MEAHDLTDSFSVALCNGDDYIKDNIRDMYPMIKECFFKFIKGSFSDCNVTVILRALEFAFGSCLELFPVENLDRELLQYSCPVATKLFLQTLEKTETGRCTSGINKDILANLLCICQEIISYLTNTFRYLETAVPAKLTDVGSLLVCSSEILFHSYQHCFQSEGYYGTLCNPLNEVLASFFLKSQILQGRLLHILSQIDWSFGHFDTNILNSALTFLYKSGIVLLNLDVKTMADLWKGYAALIAKYSELLRNQHDISIPIKFLSANVISNLEKCFAQDYKNTEKLGKAVKVLNFILKLIVMFIEKFNGCLHRCYDSLVNLLIILTKVNESHLSIFESSGTVIYEELKPLVTGIDPLLKCLIGDSEFANEILVISQSACTTPSKRIELLLFYCSIIKKLTISDVKTRKIWFGSDDNIISWLFQIFHLCSHEFCLDMKIPGVLVVGKAKRMVDCYEYVHVIISGFLIMSSSKEFVVAEKLLLKYLLQTNPWSSLLAADIWCTLARFADAELCHSQLNYLCKMLQFGNLSESPQKLFLESFISRLFPLMSQKHRDSFSVTYSPQDFPHLWPTFGVQHLSDSIRKSVNTTIYDLVVKRIDKFLSNSEHIKANYLEMESALIGLNIKYATNDFELSASIARLWDFDITQLILNPLRRIYLKSLSIATVALVSCMTGENILLVLQQIKLLFPELNKSLKLHCLENLDCFSKVVIPVGFIQPTVFNMISELFYEFLTSENVFIRLRGVQVFQNFAAHTNYSRIIMRSVNSDVVLQSTLTNYLKRKMPIEEKHWKIHEYLDKLNGVIYENICNDKCIDGMKLCQSDSYDKPSKKPKLDNCRMENSCLEKSISLLRNETNKISQYASILSTVQKQELKTVSDMLLMILE